MNGSLRIVLGLSSCSFSKKAEDDDISPLRANMKEAFDLVNRPANQTSATGAWEWIDQAIEVTADFDQLWLRGDTDFSLTGHLNNWDKKVKFVLGYDARQNLVALAQQIQETTWQQQERPARYEIETEPRTRADGNWIRLSTRFYASVGLGSRCWAMSMPASREETSSVSTFHSMVV